MQAAFLEPDFLLVGEIGGHRRVGDGERFDIDFADDLANAPEHLLAANGAQAEAHIEQAQHVEVVEAFGPVAIVLQLAGGVDAAYHGAHGAAGDAGDFIATRFDFLDDPNVRVAPRAS
ncbi:hypothetical protein D9M71_97140 [compost metagenome]